MGERFVRQQVEFAVLGRPQPAGSKKAFAHASTGQIVVVDDAKGSRPWKQEVAGAALTALGDEWVRPPFVGPIGIYVTFVLARPKSHFGTGRNARRLRPSAPDWPAVKPDATKLVRAVEDALTSVLWRDDAQIVTQYVQKVYGSPERCEVWVRALPNTVPPPWEERVLPRPLGHANPRTAVATTAAA